MSTSGAKALISFLQKRILFKIVERFETTSTKPI